MLCSNLNGPSNRKVMAKIIIKPTEVQIYNAYIAYLQKIRKPEPEQFAKDSIDAITEFIRQYEDKYFDGIFNQLDHNFYDRVRANIATQTDMREADDTAELKYSIHLRTYSNFLESKEYRLLLNHKRTSNRIPHKSQVHKERQLTEGEKRHVEFETNHRNQALRQACIDKYGYQCQCCGMDFTSIYGEELGENFIEVHHLKMISTYDESHPENYLENLVPLCSNCHSMIHHGKEGPLSLAELRAAYKGEKKK